MEIAPVSGVIGRILPVHHFDSEDAASCEVVFVVEKEYDH